MGCANGGVLPALRDGLLSEERDPFRNPMGDALRRNLSQLLHELFGEMDATAIDSALDPIIRLQVVQGFAPDDAVRFVSLLKTCSGRRAGTKLRSPWWQPRQSQN